jgi:hypothetical protein
LLSIKAHLHQNVSFSCTEGLWYHAMKLSQSSLLQFPLPFYLFIIYLLVLALFSGLFRKWHHRYCTDAANAINMMVVDMFV